MLADCLGRRVVVGQDLRVIDMLAAQLQEQSLGPDLVDRAVPDDHVGLALECEDLLQRMQGGLRAGRGLVHRAVPDTHRTVAKAAAYRDVAGEWVTDGLAIEQAALDDSRWAMPPPP